MKKYLVIANWKLNLSFKEEQNLATLLNKKIKLDSANLCDVHLVVCPSALSLSVLNNVLTCPAISLGAQDCSMYNEGSFTGEISAQSLAQAGARYCIIGHSERRTLFKETSEQVATKCMNLLEQRIIPIVCIGESELDYRKGITKSILAEQLAPLLDTVTSFRNTQKTIVLAYEPIWAIGTGMVPSEDYLFKTFDVIKELVAPIAHGFTLKLVYGGSVDNMSIKRVQLIPSIEGFLIGRASTNLEVLLKIIEGLHT